MPDRSAPGIRLDKWLWHCRFFKTRSLAAEAAAKGLRINGQRITKPAAAVRAGDIVTFTQGRTSRIVRVIANGERRGPASEAQTLYEDLTPPETDQTTAS